MRDLPSGEMRASMNTKRALEWNAWEEKPRSVRATREPGASSAEGTSEEYETPYLGPSSLADSATTALRLEP